MQQTSYKYYLGVDVSKHKLDIALPTGKTVVIANQDNEIHSFMHTYAEFLKEGVVVMEASGGYEQVSLKLLSAAGCRVSLVNAKRIRDYAKSQGILSKTDKQDAQVIQRFAQHSALPLHQSKSAEEEAKEALLKRRDQLIKLITMEKQRLEKAGNLIRRSIQRIINLLEEELARIEEELNASIEQDALFQEKREQLMSVPGIGKTLAMQLLIDLPELGSLTTKEIAALSGLAPYTQESGHYKGKRQIKGGRALVRRSLFLCVLTGIRHNKRIKAFYEKLLGKGKCKMVAIVACMRKMVTLLNVIIKKKVVWSN